MGEEVSTFLSALLKAALCSGSNFFFSDLAGLGLLGEAPSLLAIFVGLKELGVSSTQLL